MTAKTKPQGSIVINELRISGDLFNALNAYLSRQPWAEVNLLIVELDKSFAEAKALQTGPPPKGSKRKGNGHAISGDGSDSG